MPVEGGENIDVRGEEKNKPDGYSGRPNIYRTLST